MDPRETRRPPTWYEQRHDVVVCFFHVWSGPTPVHEESQDPQREQMLCTPLSIAREYPVVTLSVLFMEAVSSRMNSPGDFRSQGATTTTRPRLRCSTPLSVNLDSFP